LTSFVTLPIETEAAILAASIKSYKNPTEGVEEPLLVAQFHASSISSSASSLRDLVKQLPCTLAEIETLIDRTSNLRDSIFLTSVQQCLAEFKKVELILKEAEELAPQVTAEMNNAAASTIYRPPMV
jgi:hypothetical protein